MISKCLIIMFSWFMLASTEMYACDACGCSASNLGIGLNTDYKLNYIRISLFNSRFKSQSEYGYTLYDNFFSSNLFIRYSVGKRKRIRLMMDIPISINSRKGDGKTLVTKGLSDIRLWSNYTLFNNLRFGKSNSFYLEAGTGLNLPTGKYLPNIHDKNLPENFNVGKGNLGIIFQMNSILNLNNFGVLFNNSFLFNSRTKQNYHFGNQIISQLILFKEIDCKKFKLIPNVGFLFESISTDQYANNKYVPNTGAKAVFLSSSLNFKTNKWLTGISFFNPLLQNYSNKLIIAKEKLTIQFSIII